MKGGRRQGRQKKRWEDSIREGTGLEFAKSQRAVENREEWRKLAKLCVVPTELESLFSSMVVPQQPPRLRDRRW